MEEKIQEELLKQEQIDLQKATEESASGKEIVIVVAALLGVFVLFFAGFKAYNHFTAAAVVSVDDLHQENLENNLDEKEGYIYNGFSVVKADGLWWTEVKIGDRLVKTPLHFGPKEVESISTSGKLDQKFNLGEEVYIAIDPNVTNKYYTLAVSELSFNVVKGLRRAPVGSCTEENEACDNRTIISCANNPKNKPVIELDLDNQSGIELIGACIKISGNDFDLVKGVDRLLYQWYGVMK